MANQKDNKTHYSIPTLISMLLDKKTEWNKKSLLLAVYWMKLILSVVVGAVLGFINIQGSTGIVIYITIPVLLQFFVSNYLNIDVEEFLDNSSAVFLEGMLPCFAAFVLTWSFVFTALSSK